MAWEGAARNRRRQLLFELTGTQDKQITHSSVSKDSVPDDRIVIDYQLWLKQKTEIMALKFLVTMQIIGIVILATAIGYLLFRGY